MASSLPEAIRREMAQSDHRLRHYLWHAIRSTWLRLGTAERRIVQTTFPGWETPRPALDTNGRVLRDNDSGRDFLFMHRQMINAVNRSLGAIRDPNYPKITGWSLVPAPDDVDYPVPPVPDVPGREFFETTKSADFYHTRLAPWERQFKSEEYLRGVTLGELGADLEWTIHNAMHVRWAAASPAGYRPAGPLTGRVESRWDEPSYDYLADTYSSHVNPIFWKLHGWIDDRILDWAHANRIEGSIDWQGAWLGPMARETHIHIGAMSLAPPVSVRRKLEQVANLLVGATGFDGFFGPGSVIEF